MHAAVLWQAFTRFTFRWRPVVAERGRLPNEAGKILTERASPVFRGITFVLEGLWFDGSPGCFKQEVGSAANETERGDMSAACQSDQLNRTVAQGNRGS